MVHGTVFSGIDLLSFTKLLNLIKEGHFFLLVGMACLLFVFCNYHYMQEMQYVVRHAGFHLYLWNNTGTLTKKQVCLGYIGHTAYRVLNYLS